jgi:maltooligosyltrehalose trehalohydrolase
MLDQRAGAFDGAVLGSEAFPLRFFSEVSGDRLLLVNLGRDLHLDAAPEPLFAPPEGPALGDSLVEREPSI